MAQKYRIINLEDDLPTVSQAMQRLTYEIRAARRQNVQLMKIIHGFGSSGRGGKIRPAVRNQLDKMQKSGYLKFYICGEKLSIFDEMTRQALDLCSSLRGDSDLDRHNNGITIAIF